jgi:5-methylcytosine-specific restriction endonuclease McrA
VSKGRNTNRRDNHRRRMARGRPDCALCGEPIDYTAGHLEPLSYTIDHIIPLAKGGQDVFENIQPAHRKCNTAKSDGPTEQKLRRAVAFITTRNWK